MVTFARKVAINSSSTGTDDGIAAMKTPLLSHEAQEEKCQPGDEETPTTSKGSVQGCNGFDENKIRNSYSEVEQKRKLGAICRSIAYMLFLGMLVGFLASLLAMAVATMPLYLWTHHRTVTLQEAADSDTAKFLTLLTWVRSIVFGIVEIVGLLLFLGLFVLRMDTIPFFVRGNGRYGDFVNDNNSNEGAEDEAACQDTASSLSLENDTKVRKRIPVAFWKFPILQVGLHAGHGLFELAWDLILGGPHPDVHHYLPQLGMQLCLVSVWFAFYHALRR